MKHLYYSIPALKHNVYKYEGAVDDGAIVDDIGIEINHGVFVKITDEYLGDCIWEDGTPYE